MHTGKKRAVIDTNVVISAVLSKEGNPARIIEHLSKGHFENYITKEIIFDYISHLFFCLYFDISPKKVNINNLNEIKKICTKNKNYNFFKL